MRLAEELWEKIQECAGVIDEAKRQSWSITISFDSATRAIVLSTKIDERFPARGALFIPMHD